MNKRVLRPSSSRCLKLKMQTSLLRRLDRLHPLLENRCRWPKSTPSLTNLQAIKLNRKLKTCGNQRLPQDKASLFDKPQLRANPVLLIFTTSHSSPQPRLTQKQNGASASIRMKDITPAQSLHASQSTKRISPFSSRQTRPEQNTTPTSRRLLMENSTMLLQSPLLIHRLQRSALTPAHFRLLRQQRSLLWTTVQMAQILAVRLGKSEAHS